VADKAARDARLDQLKEATVAWADKERKRYEDEVALLKKIMKGRVGSERLNNVSTQAATDLLVDELDQFLTGE
jgi:phage gp36-like protein